MAYVYRFKHYITSEVLYVGKTSRKLKYRMNEHFNGAGHLSKKCYRKVGKIEYIELYSDADARLVEQYMINKYKPIYNTSGKSEDRQTIKLNSVQKKWMLYEDRKKSFIRFNLFGFNVFKESKSKKKKSKKKNLDLADVIIRLVLAYAIIAAVIESV